MSESKSWFNGKPIKAMLAISPHSSEWFEILLEIDAEKSVHTGNIIGAAKSKDVCSICGDSPSREMICVRVPPPDVPLPLKFRLCDDCFNIRRRDGEVWFPASTIAKMEPARIEQLEDSFLKPDV
jgi:hypothetical protein